MGKQFVRNASQHDLLSKRSSVNNVDNIRFRTMTQSAIRVRENSANNAILLKLLIARCFVQNALAIKLHRKNQQGF